MPHDTTPTDDAVYVGDLLFGLLYGGAGTSWLYFNSTAGGISYNRTTPSLEFYANNAQRVAMTADRVKVANVGLSVGATTIAPASGSAILVTGLGVGNPTTSAGAGNGIFTGGLNVGFDADPGADSLKVGDADFGFNINTGTGACWLYFESNSYFSFSRNASPKMFSWTIAGSQKMALDTAALYPSGSGTMDIGLTGNKWRDLYLSGDMKSATTTITGVASVQRLNAVGDAAATIPFWKLYDNGSGGGTNRRIMRFEPLDSVGTIVGFKSYNDAENASAVALSFTRESTYTIFTVNCGGHFDPLASATSDLGHVYRWHHANIDHIHAFGDAAGGVESVSLTSVYSETGLSSGAGTILMKSVNSATNSGWLKIYAGENARYIPYWTTDTP
jgi:hypothetical protein